jgi:hypothetical protein
MNSENNPRTGLWKKDGQRGPYYGGSIKIDEPGEYWVNLYKNDRKESDKHPDLNLQLKPKEPQAAKAAPEPGGFVDDDLDQIPF